MLSKIVKGEAGVPGAGATNHTGYYAGKSLSPEPAGGGAGGGWVLSSSLLPCLRLRISSATQCSGGASPLFPDFLSFRLLWVVIPFWIQPPECARKRNGRHERTGPGLQTPSTQALKHGLWGQ